MKRIELLSVVGCQQECSWSYKCTHLFIRTVSCNVRDSALVSLLKVMWIHPSSYTQWPDLSQGALYHVPQPLKKCALSSPWKETCLQYVRTDRASDLLIPIGYRDLKSLHAHFNNLKVMYSDLQTITQFLVGFVGRHRTPVERRRTWHIWLVEDDNKENNFAIWNFYGH